MTERRPRLGWLPPLLVGASAAVAAEVALGMLLYGGPGLVRSLTTILAVEGFAFAGGLWSAPADGLDLVDRLRRRWLLCLFAFLAAALFGSAWSFQPLLGEARWGQAAGLALLAALPLYAAGAVLGGVATAARTDIGGRVPGPGVSAATGAALGFVLTGYLLPRAPMPASMLVACLVMLSLGGMVFGAVLGARTEIDVLARRESANGEVRVQDRRIALDDTALRELWEGVHLRRSVHLEGDGPIPWDAALARAMLPGPDVPWRALVLGGGASARPRTVLREHPLAEVDVAERTAAVVELGRDHFETELAIAQGERSAVVVGNLDDLVAMVETTYDFVALDTAALAPIGGFSGLSKATRWRLFDAVAPTGMIVFGPRGADVGEHEFEPGWERQEYMRGEWGESLVLARRSGSDVPWPDPFHGFVAS